jgi:hypothetical protein
MKYTIYKNEVGQLMAMEGHCEFDGVVAKVIDYEAADFQKMIDDSGRLEWLIENNFVVSCGIDTFWVSEIDGQYRIGPKCLTPRDAIDECRKFIS